MVKILRIGQFNPTTRDFSAWSKHTGQTLISIHIEAYVYAQTRTYAFSSPGVDFQISYANILLVIS